MARYTLIKGSFPVVGTEPDGDTIRFRPDNPALLESLGPDGQRPAFSQGGTQINVRFEGVDALETHFAGTHQQIALGALAAARMLEVVGYTSVVRSGQRITGAVPDVLRGHVLANTLDSYGRMIAFVFAGESPGVDGAAIFLDPPTLAASVNAVLLAEGLVYPAFYTTLPVDLKDNLKAQSKLVRERAVGLWPQDAPSVERAAQVPTLAAASELVMWPKLFRRLVDYFRSGQSGLGGFDSWLRADPRNRDDLLQLPDGEIGNMHDLIEIAGDTIRLRYRPEDVVVLPDTFVPLPQPVPAPPPPAPLPAPAAATSDGALRIVAALVNPPGEDTGQETVTLINVSSSPLTLDGWQIRDRQLHAASRPGQRLAGALGAGETLRVALSAPVHLSNSGDDLVLLNPAGQVVQMASFAGRNAARQGITQLF